jgi:cysteine rich repeat protein
MIRLSLFLTLLAANVPFALAQHGGTAQEQSACTRDAQRFCRKDLGNDGAVQSCLQQNRAKLSTSCKKVFESHGM